jgi:hypothetical protein
MQAQFTRRQITPLRLNSICQNTHLQAREIFNAVLNGIFMKPNGNKNESAFLEGNKLFQ